MGLLERVQPDEIIYGYQFNRLSDALSGLRGLGLGAVAITSGIMYGPYFDNVDVGAGVTRTKTRFVIPHEVTTLTAVEVYFALQPLRAPKQTIPAGSTDAGTAHTHTQNSHTHVENTAAAYTQNATTASRVAVDQNESAHTHGVSAITLNSPSTMIETGMAQGVHLYVDGVDQTTFLNGPWGVGSALDGGPLNITTKLVGSQIGWHEVRMSSTALGGITTIILIRGLIDFTS